MLKWTDPPFQPLTTVIWVTIEIIIELPRIIIMYYFFYLAWLPYSRSRYAYERHKIFSHGIGVRDGAHNNIVSFLQLSPPLDSTLWHVLIWIMELPSTDRRKSPTTKCDKLLHSNPNHRWCYHPIPCHPQPSPFLSCVYFAPLKLSCAFIAITKLVRYNFAWIKFLGLSESVLLWMKIDYRAI